MITGFSCTSLINVDLNAIDVAEAKQSSLHLSPMVSLSTWGVQGQIPKKAEGYVSTIDVWHVLYLKNCSFTKAE